MEGATTTLTGDSWSFHYPVPVIAFILNSVDAVNGGFDVHPVPEIRLCEAAIDRAGGMRTPHHGSLLHPLWPSTQRIDDGTENHE